MAVFAAPIDRLSFSENSEGYLRVMQRVARFSQQSGKCDRLVHPQVVSLFGTVDGVVTKSHGSIFTNRRHRRFGIGGWHGNVADFSVVL